MTRLALTRDILADLIAYPTISTDSNLAMIDYMAAYLTELGARVDVYQDETGTKANMFATLGPDRDGGLVLSGHSDVVPVADQDWTTDPFTLDERGGKLFGRGACDMKGFIAATLALAPVYAKMDLKRPIHFSFTHDEETGCLGASAMIPELIKRGYKPAMAVIGEPTEMRVIEGHKGCCEYTTTFHGLAGHGSSPDLGVNAAEYAVRFITRLMELREDMKSRTPDNSRFEPPWTTMNIGGIRGGVAHNVIVSKAEVDWEFRPVQKSDFDYMKSSIASYVDTMLLPAMRAVHPDARIDTQTIGEVDGLEPMDENAIKDLVMELTGANAADVVPFGTEAGLFQSMGLSAIVCGPGSIAQAHKADEYVALDQLEACLNMLDGLGQKMT